MAKEIPLTQGKVALVDDADYEWLSQWKWAFNGRYAYRHPMINRKYHHKMMHRELIQPPPGMQVDHINGNTLDNRRSNLRICTPEQNSGNRRKSRGAITSVYKGVWFERSTQRWGTGVQRGKCRYPLGYYDTEIEAAYAYDAGAREVFGEFAKVNFPNEHNPLPLMKWRRSQDCKSDREAEMHQRMLSDEPTRQIAKEFDLTIKYAYELRSRLRKRNKERSQPTDL